jgi:hypothetical protein
LGNLEKEPDLTPAEANFYVLAAIGFAGLATFSLFEAVEVIDAMRANTLALAASHIGNVAATASSAISVFLYDPWTK